MERGKLRIEVPASMQLALRDGALLALPRSTLLARRPDAISGATGRFPPVRGGATGAGKIDQIVDYCPYDGYGSAVFIEKTRLALILLRGGRMNPGRSLTMPRAPMSPSFSSLECVEEMPQRRNRGTSLRRDGGNWRLSAGAFAP